MSEEVTIDSSEFKRDRNAKPVFLLPANSVFLEDDDSDDVGNTVSGDSGDDSESEAEDEKISKDDVLRKSER